MKRLQDALDLLEHHFWRIVGTEWDENWQAWPHCNGQAGCWMHTESRWCGCACHWCKLARTVRPHLHRERNST